MSKRRPADNIEFKSFEDLFGISDVKEEDIREIRIEEIHSFSNHPFKVVDDKRMKTLVNSVRENGIMTPVLLRQDSSGYEIISGHRRTFAAKQVGLVSVPAIVREMTDDEAVIAMVDSNLQRDVILPSEKAFALRMKLDAMKHQGKRISNGETSCQSGTKSRSDEVLARSFGTSASNIHRLIRLTYLREGLLDLVDRKKIGMSQAVDLSYIDADGQDLILEVLDQMKTYPKAVQAKRLRESSASGKLTRNKVEEILTEKTSIQNLSGIMIPPERIMEYFPSSFSDEEKLNVIYKLLGHWRDSAVQRRMYGAGGPDEPDHF